MSLRKNVLERQLAKTTIARGATSTAEILERNKILKTDNCELKQQVSRLTLERDALSSSNADLNERMRQIQGLPRQLLEKQIEAGKRAQAALNKSQRLFDQEIARQKKIAEKAVKDKNYVISYVVSHVFEIGTDDKERTETFTNEVKASSEAFEGLVGQLPTASQISGMKEQLALYGEDCASLKEMCGSLQSSNSRLRDAVSRLEEYFLDASLQMGSPLPNKRDPDSQRPLRNTIAKLFEGLHESTSDLSSSSASKLRDYQPPTNPRRRSSIASSADRVSYSTQPPPLDEASFVADTASATPSQATIASSFEVNCPDNKLMKKTNLHQSLSSLTYIPEDREEGDESDPAPVPSVTEVAATVSKSSLRRLGSHEQRPRFALETPFQIRLVDSTEHDLPCPSDLASAVKVSRRPSTSHVVGQAEEDLDDNANATGLLVHGKGATESVSAGFLLGAYNNNTTSIGSWGSSQNSRERALHERSREGADHRPYPKWHMGDAKRWVTVLEDLAIARSRLDAFEAEHMRLKFKLLQASQRKVSDGKNSSTHDDSTQSLLQSKSYDNLRVKYTTAVQTRDTGCQVGPGQPIPSRPSTQAQSTQVSLQVQGHGVGADRLGVPGPQANISTLTSTGDLGTIEGIMAQSHAIVSQERDRNSKLLQLQSKVDMLSSQQTTLRAHLMEVTAQRDRNQRTVGVSRTRVQHWKNFATNNPAPESSGILRVCTDLEEALVKQETRGATQTTTSREDYLATLDNLVDQFRGLERLREKGTPSQQQQNTPVASIESSSSVGTSRVCGDSSSPLPATKNPDLRHSITTSGSASTLQTDALPSERRRHSLAGGQPTSDRRSAMHALINPPAAAQPRLPKRSPARQPQRTPDQGPAAGTPTAPRPPSPHAAHTLRRGSCPNPVQHVRKLRSPVTSPRLPPKRLSLESQPGLSSASAPTLKKASPSPRKRSSSQDITFSPRTAKKSAGSVSSGTDHSSVLSQGRAFGL